MIHIRTRTFDPNKWPFYTLEAERLADADWLIFMWDEAALVAPGAELRDLAPTTKPTFYWDESDVWLWLGGGRYSIVSHWQGDWSSIADREAALVP